jgi:hypothetical protein
VNKYFSDAYKTLNAKLDIERFRSIMLLWNERTLGHQISLHSDNSSLLDSDQLAWSLSTFLHFQNRHQTDLEDQHFVKHALTCLFSTQNEVGTWRHYKPLFHYKETGSAYCYSFETFASLLRAFLKPDAEFLRSLLKSFFPNLIRFWQYARATQLRLPDSDGIGWSSGHRQTVRAPESWATANVFAYAQALRRLIGIWTKEDAPVLLHRLPGPSEDAETVLHQRGDTWSDTVSTAEQLYCMFVNPVRKNASENSMEPDAKPINTDQPRSAILFGPPGTSKTTLARAVASAIKWEYLELHASHFMADGLPQVHRTADYLFSQLMELDHTVVLFDEIDELVREREQEHDAFGRFLTTSMLPKLAELWQQRKIIYFIATNHINYFDRAVTRSQRFDALLFVPPPSFEKKKARLGEMLGLCDGRRVEFEFEKSDFDRALQAAAALGQNEKRRHSPLPDKMLLAKFILLRWDQLDELAQYLAKASGDEDPCIVSKQKLCQALKKVRDLRLGNTETYYYYAQANRYIGRDFSKYSVWLVNGPLPDPPPKPLVRAGDQVWLQSDCECVADIRVRGYHIENAGPGRVTCTAIASPR